MFVRKRKQHKLFVVKELMLLLTEVLSKLCNFAAEAVFFKEKTIFIIIWLCFTLHQWVQTTKIRMTLKQTKFTTTTKDEHTQLYAYKTKLTHSVVYQSVLHCLNYFN